jgi:hypothetical protein
VDVCFVCFVFIAVRFTVGYAMGFAIGGGVKRFNCCWHEAIDRGYNGVVLSLSSKTSLRPRKGLAYLTLPVSARQSSRATFVQTKFAIILKSLAVRRREKYHDFARTCWHCWSRLWRC